ncbi:MAG: SDR family NAD(P)-dependent oxidoreductase [Desulfurococcaceae archaeon]
MIGATRVLVTGGAGFIGSHLVDKLVALGFQVRVVDNLSSGRLENIRQHLENRRIEFIDTDLKNVSTLKEALEGIDAVFHFAANPEVRVSTVNPEIHFSENVVASFNLLEVMRQKDITNLVFASSSSVYGETWGAPVKEDIASRPVSVYAASKAACENLIHAYSKLYGFNALLLRYANIVGPRLRHGVIYDLLVKLSKVKDKLEVLGDGTQIRSYLHVNDAVDATVVAWLKSRRGFELYNVGNLDYITVNEVVDTVIKTMGIGDVKLIYKPVLHGVGWPGDVKRIVMDISKMLNMGWRPSMGSRDAVRATVVSLLNELKRDLPL